MRLLNAIWVVILLVAAVCAASAQTLNAISVVETSLATEVQLDFDAPARESDKLFIIAEGAPRLVLDFNGADYSLKHKSNRALGAGLAKSVRFAQRGPSEANLRVVIDLTNPNVHATPSIKGNTLTLILQTNVSSAAAVPEVLATNLAPVSKPRYFKNKMPYPRIKPDDSVLTPPKLARKPVIVIDPGHGGNDPGAIGVAGTFEKKITWAASVELKKQLEATGRYTVLMTRSEDVYVAHDERLRIARAGGADLFLSIHADATASGSARGASVYTLADRAINRSKRIVNSQNWIMDVDLSEQSDPVGDILVDLAQRKTATQSDEFAELLITKLSKSTRLIGNTHRRAGYFVLLAPDVPAVLLELGFLSNADDEALLNQEAHRKKVITSVTKAINLHFDKQKS